MPDKRQTSKQRRAARNKAYRDAMIARRENARAEREQARQAGASRAAGPAGPTASTPGGPAPGIAGALYRRPPGPGDTAVLAAVLFAVLAAGLSLYVAFSSSSVPVDHAGDPIGSFPALRREAYAIAHDTEPVTRTVSLVDAYGPLIPILAVLPALVAIGAFVAHRRQPRSRPLTFGLVALALVSVFNLFAMYFLPALIALAIAGFQVRKTEVPGRMAGPGAGARRQQAGHDDEDDVIDVDEVEPDDKAAGDTDVEDRDRPADNSDEAGNEDEDRDRPADNSDEAGNEDEDVERDDVLADLEAEIDDETDTEAETERGGRNRGAGGRSSRR